MNEFVIAVFLFTLIIMLLSALIAGVRYLLMAGGDVPVVINDNRTLRLPVGKKLLFALADEGIFLPSACGGRGTCGNCRLKILKGGGTLLPTEKALITPKQAAQGERLACQLTVMNPLQIVVPEEILGIRQLKCTVYSNCNVASFIKELVLELPSEEGLNFRAGSYIQIETPPYNVDFNQFHIEKQFRAEWDRHKMWRYRSISKHVTSRAYSLANYPGESNKLILNVRIATPPPSAPDAPPGIVSSYLFSLKPGDSIAVTGPFGEFCAKPTNKEMIFIGGGAGMAPLRSMILDQLLRLKTTRTISFWYGARSLNELFYENTFNALAQEHENFRWQVALSEPLPEDDWQGSTGFIHQVVYDQLLKDHPRPEACEFYLCGPPLMMRAVLKVLKELGVEEEQIAKDDFGEGDPPIESRGRSHG